MENPVAACGVLSKMPTAAATEPAHYTLRVGEQHLELDNALGARVRIEPTGRIFCLHCGRATKKSFAQGFCYPCFKGLARCDLCIVKPETCHYHLGTCREPEWGETHCFAPHVVYLANASGAKVGITKPSQIPTRWIDQGASQALIIARVATRQQAGFVEALLRERVSDRTNWQKMLKGAPAPVDLPALRDELFEQLAEKLEALKAFAGPEAITLVDEPVVTLSFPIERYPTKVTTWNLDKHAVVDGRLEGIKGQYLLLDSGVLNVRKFGGYEVNVRIEPEGTAVAETGDLFT
ncbi:DUF2797 domain-containing protein [Larsenimonas suaedae]|uniref:DUF2797 domain-containing protein n=1 Tax=Larsenimonas suaedae TaxID=1851019 RepID=A0ABU1GYX5_9GAMM|nr:DUF2797 domain-containing protein [Larsenimonas suaedae]MCM2971510.1 DUF2797 domain-containing protein [Larsenimonas suaedae]MDR5896766.1 DUF2797 domain-containing protein [Larsenimonas suaedae]